MLFQHTLLIDPKPTPRPRVARFGGVFYPKAYRPYYARLVELFGEARGDQATLDEPMDAKIEVVVKRPKKTVREYPGGDWDNYAKGVMDAAQKAGVILDDTAIQAGSCSKRFGEPGEPGSITLTLTTPGST